MRPLQVATAAALFAAPATAAPVPLAHQGRLLDALGTPLSGAFAVEARLVDETDAIRHTETFDPVAVADGYYALELRPEESLLREPLDLVILIEGQALGRSPLRAVPRAANAGIAGLSDADTVLLGHTRVLHLSLDEGAGELAYDRSGAGTHGVLGYGPAGPPAWVEGRRRAGLSFDGVDDCVRVPNDPANQFRDGFTLMAWVKPHASAVYGRLVAKHFTNNNRSWDLSIDNARRPLVHFSRPDNTSYNVTGPDPLPADTWSHVAGTYDPSTGVQRLYVNGAEVASATIGTQRIMATSLSVTVGCYHDSSNDSIYREFFKGTLDEVVVIPYALPAADLAAIAGAAP